MHRRFTDEEESAIAARYLKGETAPKLASELRCSSTTMAGLLHRQGVVIRAGQPRGHRQYNSEAMIAEVLARYHGGESRRQIGLALGISGYVVNRILRESGVKPRDFRTTAGENHWRWKGGRHVRKDGYVSVHTVGPDGNRKWQVEHRMVMAEHLGRELLDNETIHHKNGNRGDNRIDNLELRVGPHGKGATHAHCATCRCFD